jgi:DNA phosphorothioation-associated putative methyltransferase
MSTNTLDSRTNAQLGKRVLDDFYIHTAYLYKVLEDPSYQPLVQSGLAAMTKDDLRLCNVAKINLHRNRLSFLEYLNFEHDPFPTLNVSWVFNPSKQKFSIRSYSTSLNPPILHRKELLVGHDHPQRDQWQRITSSAEALGLFSSGKPIGFRLNWLRLIADKGFRLVDDQLLPLGNEVELLDIGEFEEITGIHRHLTALSRSSLSAPMQLMISNGMITQSIEVFDYGCGRGDDIRGLTEIGLKCQGWDPHFANENPIVPAEIVNLGFVVNVIEDPAERVEAIQRAFGIAKVALVVSVMLHSKVRPGKPYLDGFLTSRNTFQKYFSQEEFKDYLEGVLGNDAIMLGPGIALIFSDKEAEQRFVLGRHRSSNVARRLLGARLSPKTPRLPREHKTRIPRILKAAREFEELRPTLEFLWAQTLDLGRFPEPFEISDFERIQEKISFNRAKRLVRTHFDQRLLEAAAQTRADDIKLFFAARHFEKKSPYRELDIRLKTDIKYFFNDFKTANQEALKLLLQSADPDEIRNACEKAAADGIGWLEENSHSLQLHVSLLERLPSVLRAYVTCGLILWDNLGEFQLIKIHVQSGKLSLMEYLDFDATAIPLLIKRIKINILKLDYDVYEYEANTFPPPPLLYKSRYMHEDMNGYAEQLEFDEALEATGLLNEFDHAPTLAQIKLKLGARRLEIAGMKLTKSTTIPSLDQPCGLYLKFRDLIHCGETQARLGIPNIPLNPETYNALHSLATQVLDPVIEYFGAIRLTYGFCSTALGAKISSRVAPKLDQHASHECNKKGLPICDRLGAAADFIIEDEDMIEVAQWITQNLPFDRMYLYGRGKPIHISLSSTPSKLVTFMVPTATGRLMPRTCLPEAITQFRKQLTNFF